MQKITRRSVVVLALAALAGLGLIAHSAGQPAASAAPASAPAARPVTVEAVRLAGSDFTDAVSAVGTLKSNESVVLRPETSGRVASIGFRDGAVVNKGDLLIALDAAVQEAEVAQARANLALAQSTHRRNGELLARKFISPQALEASAATLNIQEAALALAQAKAARMRIRAPFRGVVGLREVSVGDYIKEGEELVNIEDIARLRVDFKLPEAYSSRVAPGQSVELASDALPGQRFVAQLAAIDPQLDPAARSIALRARLDNAAGRLRPGMFVRVRLVFGERQDVLMLPEEAVIPGTRPAVFKVVDGKAARTEVRLGARRDARVEVIDGLTAGDVVVTAGQMKLRPGVPVNPVGLETPAVKPAAASQ